MKIADKMFEKLGYQKVEDSNILVVYEKTIQQFGYTHVIEFCHKRSGNHHVISYQRGLNTDGFNNSIGLGIPEIKAIKRKIKELRW